MINTQLRFSGVLTLLVILLLSLSCTDNPLPQAPAFEELGFDNALKVVHEQMFSAYQRFQEKPENAELNGSLGMLLTAYSKSAASGIFFRRARMLDPTEFRWTYYLAITTLQLGRFDEATALFREALIIEPDNIEARMQLADALLQINEFEQSIELYRAITTELPDRVDAWLGLGKALDYSGDLGAAIIALKRATAVGPQFGEVHFALAAALSASGDEEAATAELDAYKKNKQNKISRSDRYTRSVIRLNASDGPYMAKADFQLSRGQFKEAVRFFNRALEINPANQDAWGGLIFAQAKLDDIDATGASYRAALDAGITYKRLHFTYAQALLSWQQFDAARDVMGKAIELDPQYTEALVAMGELELQRGASAAAVKQLSRAVDVVPNDRNVRLALAQALNAAKQFEDAAHQLEPLFTDPTIDTALALKELAIAYHGLKRNNQAIDTLQRAREVASKKYDRPMLDSIDALLGEWQS